jgi:hypothetical protein
MKISISDWANTLPRLHHPVETPMSVTGSGQAHVNDANGLFVDEHGFDSDGNPDGADMQDWWSNAYWPDDA